MGIAPFGLLGLGFLLGVRHAFDADHIAAVSTIVSKHKSIKISALVGIFWGLGHTLSLLLVGSAILLFKIEVPKRVALSFEFIVGIMLVLLGFNVLATINKNKVHLHRHKHGKEKHIHFHSHRQTKSHWHEHQLLNKSLLVGIVHGLAGSAAIALLALATINSIWLGVVYTLLFGIGSVTGMALISSIISLPFALTATKFWKIQKVLGASAGLISMAMGFIIIYKIGI